MAWMAIVAHRIFAMDGGEEIRSGENVDVCVGIFMEFIQAELIKFSGLDTSGLIA